MNKSILQIALGLMVAMGLLLGSMQEASAARMGSGKSFGSRPSYSTPYQRSPGMGQPGGFAQQPAVSPAQARNQGIRDTMAQRGGFGRFLGGLALGGLLGALFMGGGFEHINFLDILVFAGIAFLLMRLFAARRQSAEARPTPAGYAGHTGDSSPCARNNAETGAGFDTDIFSRGGNAAPKATPAPAAFPSDFDQSQFISGAKAAYTMMQAAWDRGDLAELRALTTDKVFGELQDQIRARGNATNQTDLLKVECEVLEVRDVSGNREATVLFDVMMREDPAARPQQVREVWHFTRALNSRQPTWFLDGIQQLED